MARKHKHEDHQNHEAWAVPYGDLVTLLLAFFVVMYSISSVNEGKYRAVSASLTAAFRGLPRTNEPIQVGEVSVRSSGEKLDVDLLQPDNPDQQSYDDTLVEEQSAGGELEDMAEAISQALAPLIEDGVVIVRSTRYWLEVEIQTDILFPSAVATLSAKAETIIRQLAAVLAQYPNPLRVEGHTDNLPIRTSTYASNWELSAARAASVVRIMTASGIKPARLAVIGLGEHHPIASNDTPQGRNQNRRVLMVVLANTDMRKTLDNMQNQQTGARAKNATLDHPAGRNHDE